MTQKTEYTGLTGVPDIDRAIAFERPFDQISNLCQTNKTFSKLCRDESFWRAKWQKDFHGPSTFRELYSKEARRLSQQPDHGLSRATDDKLWDIVVYLIREYSADFNKLNFSRVLYYAILSNQIKIINLLLDNYLDSRGGKYYYVKEDGELVDLMSLAIGLGNVPAVKAFLDHGAYEDDTLRDKEEDLAQAAYGKQQNIAKLLLDAGATTGDPQTLTWLEQVGLIRTYE